MDNLYKLSHDVPSKKDYIDTTDFDQDEILDIIKTGVVVRDYIKSGGTLDTMYHKNLAMLFEQKSTRTRVSFEVAMMQLGGHALNLAMSALGAFVHPLRLTFVEYFKNLGYEGSGTAYTPFKSL